MNSLLNELPSVSGFLAAYTSLTAIALLFRSLLNDLIPQNIRDYLFTKLSGLAFFHTHFTFIIEDRWNMVDNQTFRAAELYLPTRISIPSTDKLLLGSGDLHDLAATPKFGIPVDTTIVDHFEGIKVEWILRCVESKKHFLSDKRHFNLTCKRNARDHIINNYIPSITKMAQTILDKPRDLKLYTFNKDRQVFESTIFKHPSTFDTLALDPELNQFIIDDLDAFAKRKDFFKRVGRAWKRGYLLYGPPGTGKSSLVAAMANHMKYDVYDLQFDSVSNDAALREILTLTTNRSILLIEDIDCTTKASGHRAEIPDPVPDSTDDVTDTDDTTNAKKKRNAVKREISLSGLLNFIDGLWSTCGEERIIIFTTNHKEKLDPALLRPGRMDVHIHMGYCTFSGFRKLAWTYLGSKDHALFGSIENLIENVEITPAEVAQQLMISSNPDVALNSLVQFLEKKKNEKMESVGEDKKNNENVTENVREKQSGTDGGSEFEEKTA